MYEFATGTVCYCQTATVRLTLSVEREKLTAECFDLPVSAVSIYKATSSMEQSPSEA
jgi:hypothetical protein